MSLLKKLAGQTVLYGVSSILGRTLNFLLTPLFATYLTISEFGVSVDIYSIAAVLNIIYLFGFETTYFRFARKEAADEKGVFNQIESTLLVSSLAFSVLLVAMASPLATFLEYPNSTSYIYYLAIILFTDTIVAIPFARLRLNNKAASFAFIKIVNIVLNVVLNIFFLVVCKAIVSTPATYPNLYKIITLFYTEGDNVKYVFLSNIIANALLIPIFFRSFLTLNFKINFSDLKKMFYYAYPLVILGLAGMINEMLSRMIFKKVLPEGFYSNYTEQEALGIFGACYKISMFMSLAIQSCFY
jgi:O-antigen/teichoic acid export membrane protein